MERERWSNTRPFESLCVSSCTRTTGDTSYNLYFQFCGENDNPCIIFHHGYTGSSRYFSEILGKLREYYFCVLLDCHGCGQSGGKDDSAATHSMLNYAEDVIAVADQLQIGKFVFVGFSMGGGIGKLLALHHPTRVSKLVLLSPTPSNRALTKVFTPEFHKMMGDMRRTGIENKDQLVYAFQNTLATGRAVPKEVLGIFIEDWLAASEAHFEGMYQALREFTIDDSQLQSISIPTLFVDGSDSPCILETLREYQLFPVSTLHIFSRASHDFVMEMPGEVEEVIVGFLRYGVTKTRSPSQDL